MKQLMNLDVFVDSTAGEVMSTHATQFLGVGTDTRKNLTGQLFIALKGETFDAHDYLQKAVDQGASGLVVSQTKPEIAKLAQRVTVIQVRDTLKALQNFSAAHRKASSAKIIGITGSNGKTSSKEFAATVLKTKLNVHYSAGSFNNHWGVPFTLLGIEREHTAVLVEMGMNHAGELTQLVRIAQPNVVVVTMVGRAHFEHFGSIENIARAKEEIYTEANPHAVRVYNLDCPQTFKMYQNAVTQYKGARTLTFSADNDRADVVMRLLEATSDHLKVDVRLQGDRKKIEIPVFGAHNLTNLMVAATLGLSCDLKAEDIFLGLEKCQNSWGRNQWLNLKSQARLLFDGYNANPDSMAALLTNVKTLGGRGRKIAVLAEMLEMGPTAADLHFELGEKAALSGLDFIWFFGPHAGDFERGLKAQNFQKSYSISETYEQTLAQKTASMLQAGDVVIVKGSRGMHAERFVELCQPLAFTAAKT